MHATLASKLEVKGEQLAEAQAALRDARADMDELRTRPGLPGARGRLEGLRDAQQHLRALRSRMREGAGAPRAAWEEEVPHE